MKQKKSYTLSSALAIHRKHPRTFWLPSAEERENLQPGQHAKLLFRGTTVMPSFGRVGSERMWVKVRTRKGRTYTGTLANNPITIPGLRFGAKIVFGPQHVADIE